MKLCHNSKVIGSCLFLVCLFSPAQSEIHRTRTSRPRPRSGEARLFYPGSPETEAALERDTFATSAIEKPVCGTEVGLGDKELTLHPENEGVVECETTYYSRDEAWIYAILATVLVGLTGIFPLLLPIEIDQSPNNKGAAKFNCILSFAVGGLLGDVFLHLLPEAWTHIGKDDHSGHIKVGLWILVGMLVFLSLEKIFGENDGMDAGDEVEKAQSTHSVDTTQNGTMISKGKQTGEMKCCSRDQGIRRDSANKRKLIQNVTCDGINGERLLESVSGKNAKNCHGKTDEVDGEDKTRNKLKVVGYLNLLANFIDNFTHGIAVAGSFLVSRKVGALTTAAILLHEVPHEVGDYAILLRSGFSRWQAAKSQMSTAVGGLLGAMVTLLSESAQEAGDRAAWILPFTAGGFLHIAMVTVLPDLLQESSPKESMKQTVCLLAGITVMATVSIVAE